MSIRLLRVGRAGVLSAARHRGALVGLKQLVLGQQQQRRLNSTEAAAAAVSSDAVVSAATTLGWSPSHLVMQAIDGIHVFGGVPYWEAVIAFTMAFRIAILPLGVWTAQGSARMAAVRPHIQKLSDRLKSNPNADARAKQEFAMESRALMKHYKVNPLTALMMPLVQFPIFISCFFGLQSMGEFFPGFATGGAFWFTNLTAADPYLILPAVNALSFLVMIEMGADGLQTSDQDTFKWVMRGLAVALTPLTMHMSQGLFIYWGANNAFSIAQAAVLKQQAMRKWLDIPPPPTMAAAPLKLTSPFRRMAEAWRKERLVGDRAKAEIVDGTKFYASSVVGAASPPVKPVVTYTQKPTSKKNK